MRKVLALLLTSVCLSLVAGSALAVPQLCGNACITGNNYTTCYCEITCRVTTCGLCVGPFDEGFNLTPSWMAESAPTLETAEARADEASLPESSDDVSE